MPTFVRMRVSRPWTICILAGLVLAAINSTASAEQSTNKLCGFSPQQWSTNLAIATTQRRGNPLPFTYWNLALAVSMLDLADRTNEVAMRDYAESIVARFVAADGSISGFPPAGFEHLQTIPTGQIFIRMYERTGDERYRKAALVVRESMNALPRTAGGVFAWRPHQVWLDGLWFSMPFYAEYGRLSGETAIFDDIRRQYAAVFEHSRDPKSGLLHHGWDEKREQFWANPRTGTSSAIWSRAVGWYAISLVQVLDEIPEGHAARPYLIRLLSDVAQSVARYQDRDSGLWRQVIDQPDTAGNYLESSGTAMFVYAMAKGVNRGYLDRRFSAIAWRAYRGLIADKVELDLQGRWSLVDIVQSAGLGAPPVWPPGSPPPSARDASPRGRDGSAQYYLEQPRVKDHSFGVAPFIWAGIEVEHLLKQTSSLEEGLKLEQVRCRPERDILDAERQWREAWIAGDAAALDRIHADDYIAIPNVGSTSTKAEVMADVRRGVFRYSRMEHSEQSVRFHGPTAVVVGRTTNEGRRGDRDVSGAFRYTRIYVKRDDRWQAVLSQYTRIAEASASH
jgi:unsaturated rhamnogalacturonyl hydrolase